METEERNWFQPARPYVSAENDYQPPKPAKASRKHQLARSYADIEPTEQDYLWTEHIPLGDVTLVGGDGGIGKGRFFADLTSRVTRGDNMIDGTTGLGDPGNVVLITPEDDPSTSMAWRLRAHNADLSRVFDMTELPGGEFSLPGDIAQLRKFMLECGDVKLVIIDPLSQVSEKSLQANATVRRFIWGPLRQLAKDTGAAIVVMLHTTKGGSLQGSRGLTDAARVVLLITRDKTDPRVRVVSVMKGNDVDDGTPDVCYTLTGSRPNVRVEFVDRELEQLAEGLTPLEKRILIIVNDRAKEGKHTDPQKVADVAKITYGNAKVALHRMAKKGVVKRMEERGWYTMPEKRAA